MGASRVPQNFGDAGPRPLTGRVWPPRNTTLPNMCYLAEFGQTDLVWSNVRWLVLNYGDPSHPALQLKMAQGHWNRRRSVGYLWLHVSVPWPISYRFRDKMRYSQNSPTPVYLTPRWHGSPWNFVTALGSNIQNNALTRPSKMWWLSFRLDTVPALADRRTDKHLVKQYRAVHALHADAR